MFGKALVSSLVSLVACAPLFAAPGPVKLAYAPAAGAVWSYEVETVTKIPILGTDTLRQRWDITCQSVSGDVAHMSFLGPEFQVDGKTLGPLDGTLDLEPDGAITKLASPQVADPGLSPYVRNVTLLFPSLGGGATAVGESWEHRSVLSVPPNFRKGPGASLPDKIAVDGAYQFARADAAGVAVVSVKLREAAGEPLKVDLAGEFQIELATGRPLGAKLAGTLKLRKGLIPITVPIAITLSQAR